MMEDKSWLDLNGHKDSRYTDSTERSRYPFCIVWCPISPYTWLLPFIGHVGIADSKGVIHDFSHSRRVNIDKMAFCGGKPYKYVNFRVPRRKEKEWDSGILEADEIFR